MSSCNNVLQLFRNASVAVGYEVFFSRAMKCRFRPEVQRAAGLTGKLIFFKLFPILVAVDIRGHYHTVYMYSSVHAVNSLSTYSPLVVKYFKQLVLISLRWNILFKAEHVPGIQIYIVDALFCQQHSSFWHLVPDTERVQRGCGVFVSLSSLGLVRNSLATST